MADSMLKAAAVTLVRASVVCAGRLLIVVEGDREAVETAVRTAREAEASLAGSYIISPVDPQVQAALRRRPQPAAGQALGVVECRNAADGVMAADAAVKKAQVALMRLVLGQGIGGKSFFVLTATWPPCARLWTRPRQNWAKACCGQWSCRARSRK